MRIGLYGMPTAGKTYIMDRIDFIDVLVGSRLLREYDPDFDSRDEEGREHDRKAVAKLMMEKETFIMDGHYAFGDEIAFTDEEGEMYDVYLYLYISPVILRKRMESSVKNGKYLKYDIEDWQNREIVGLRDYCHRHNKDFYVLDNPPANEYADIELALSFIREIVDGYSCAAYARRCADEILKSSERDTILLIDGDKTLTKTVAMLYLDILRTFMMVIFIPDIRHGNKTKNLNDIRSLRSQRCRFIYIPRSEM